jgi:RND family efflux transporter MFP subunit
MTDSIAPSNVISPRHQIEQRLSKPGVRAWAISVTVLAAVAVAVIFAPSILNPAAGTAAAPPPPHVIVSKPLQHQIDERLDLLGQFSAVQKVELRAQVGGILSQIGFKDGDIVHKGDPLFQIDPTPYQIRLASAQARLESAQARLDLANRETVRAQTLSRSGAGTVENTDQRIAERRAAQAAIDDAHAAMRDAQFDLDRTRIVAPFEGKIGSHQVSVGNLISGSRAGTSPTTLLATIVSVGSIYFDFDMSESDYQTFLKYRQNIRGPLAEQVRLSSGDDPDMTRQGTLDFIDNTLDRASGTIHARATVPDDDLSLTPGGFARVRVEVAPPHPALLVPDVAVIPDQTQNTILTVGANNVVIPKLVQVGEVRDGLRVITSGLATTDRVIIDGIPVARPGTRVLPQNGIIHFGSNQVQG